MKTLLNTLMITICISSCMILVAHNDIELGDKHKNEHKTLLHASKNTGIIERIQALKDYVLEPDNIRRVKFHTLCGLGYVSNVLLMYMSFDQGQSLPVGPPSEVIHLPTINYHNGTQGYLGQSYYFHRANNANFSDEAVWYTANNYLLPVFNEPQFAMGFTGFVATFLIHTNLPNHLIKAIKELCIFKS